MSSPVALYNALYRLWSINVCKSWIIRFEEKKNTAKKNRKQIECVSVGVLTQRQCVFSLQAMRLWPLRTGARRGNSWRSWPAWRTSSLLLQVATPGHFNSFLGTRGEPTSHDWSITNHGNIWLFLTALFTIFGWFTKDSWKSGLKAV